MAGILDPNELAISDRKLRARDFVRKGLNAIKAARQQHGQLALILNAEDDGNLFIGAIVDEIIAQGALLLNHAISIVGKEGNTPIQFVALLVKSPGLVLQ